MTALEQGIGMLGITGADWAGLAAAGWVVACLVALLAVRQAARADRLGVRAAEAAHELRGPLCAARLALTGLERAFPDAPTLIRGIAAIDLELRRAGLALDELGSLASSRQRRAEAASAADRELVDLRALAMAAEPAWQALAAAHETTLDVRIEGGPVIAAGDERELARGIGNLVANACEHGRGPVLVTVTGDASGAVVEVADRGPGPAVGVVRRARRRASMRRAGRRHGSLRGHGMAVAARAAASSGGRLDVEATAAGAVVSLALPSSGVTGHSTPARPTGCVGRGFRRPRAAAPRPPLAGTR